MFVCNSKKRRFFILALLVFLSATVTACEGKVPSVKAMAGQPTELPSASGGLKTVPISPPVQINPVDTKLTTETTQSQIPTPQVCLAAGGRFEKASLATKLLPVPMDVRIYLPPCYDESSNDGAPQTRYPVLYLFHGQGFTEDQWDRLGADDVAERLIVAHEIAPFIIVMSRERIWEDPDINPYGHAVIDVLIPWIDKTYRTIPDRQHRAVGGLSRGAAWAVNLGFSYWELFGAIGVHSGFNFKSDVRFIQGWIRDIPLEYMPRIFLDIGDMDYLKKPNRELESILVKKGILHEWYLFPGRHEEAYWSQHIEQYIRWYAINW